MHDRCNSDQRRRDSSNLLEAGRRPVRSQIPLRYLVADRFEAGSKPVADRSEAGRGLASSCCSSLLAS